MEKNPNYWGKIPSIAAVELLIINDETTGINLFEQGQIDLLTRISNLDFPRLKKQGKVHTSPFLATYYLSFNLKKFPFNDRVWRKAVAGTIQRQEIATLLNSGEIPATSWIPYGLEGYIPFKDPKPLFKNSVEMIKNKNEKPVGIQAAFDSGTRNLNIMEKVQQDIAQSLGLQLILNNLDWKTYIHTIQTDPPPIYRFAWMAPFLDPISHLKAWTTDDPNNYNHWSCTEYDQLVQEIEEMGPGPKRVEKIEKAQKILIEKEAVLIPLYHYVFNTAVSGRVKNFRVNPFGVTFFEELSLE